MHRIGKLQFLLLFGLLLALVAPLAGLPSYAQGPGITPIEPQALLVGEVRALPVTFSGPEGSTVGVSADNAAIVTATFDALTSQLTLTALAEGTTNVQVTLYDSQGGVLANTSFAVTVTLPPPPPPPPDADRDGFPDGADNCPAVANADQLDADGDGAGNACDLTPNGDTDLDGLDNLADNCPLVANVDQADTDGDLIGNACDTTPNGDSDLDGVDNLADNCPAVANPDQLDADADLLGDLCDTTPNGDADLDGVDNLADNCPLVANADQLDSDGDLIGDLCDETPTPTPAPTEPPAPPALPPTIVSDALDYPPGGYVTLTGANWQGDTQVRIYVNDDVGSSWQRDVFVNVAEDGTVTDAFYLPAWFVATYKVVATGQQTNRVAWTTFTDDAVGTYDQCSNDKGAGYTSGDLGCRWINGNLQGSNSVYKEGDATVQRLWLTGLVPGSTHSVTFDYGTTKGGKHAYDFLTTWDWSEDWIQVADRCQGIAGCETAPESGTNIPNDPNVPDTFEPNSPGSRQFIMRGGTLTGATFNAPIPFTGSYSGDSDTRITVTFTVGPSSGAMCSTKQGVTTCDIALWFGAHVSAQANWGLGMGAGSISGSPYHVSLAALDGASAGSRDNQMQASAVTAIPNGTIVIVKDAVPNDAQDFSFNLTNNDTITQNFSLDDDADATLSNSQTFSVPPGMWTATELNIPSGWTLTGLTCSDPTNNSTVSLVTGTATINLASSETVTCTYTNTRDAGSLVISKVFDPLTSGFAGTFSINYDCDDGTVHDGTVTLSAGGSQTISGIPTGTQCTVSEPTLPTAPTGWTFGTPSVSPAQPVTIGASPVTVTVTNTISRDLGSLKIIKSVTGGTFSGSINVSVTCTGNGGSYSPTIVYPTPGFVVINNIPTSSCTVSETLPTPPSGYSWGTSSFSVNPAIITKGATAEVTITNPLTRDTGTLEVTKMLSNPDGAVVPASFQVSYTCTDGTDILTGGSSLAPGGTASFGSIPTGYTCTVTETAPAAISGYTWGPITYTPASVTILAKDGVYTIIVGNSITRDRGALKIEKTLSNSEGAAVPATFAVDYNCGTGYMGTVNVAPGAPATVSGIPTGSVCAVTEQAPAVIPGYTWGDVTYSPASVTITDKDTTYTIIVGNSITRDRGTLTIDKLVTGADFTGSFSVSVVCDGDGGSYTRSIAYPDPGTVAIIGIPTSTCMVTEPTLPTPPAGYSWADPVITGSPATISKGEVTQVNVTNKLVRDTGTLEVKKELSNPDGAAVPATFAVDYNCGTGYTGTVNVAPGAPATVSGIPTGSVCAVTEQAPAVISGYTWGDVTYSPTSVTILAKDGVYTITVGNSITRDILSLEINKVATETSYAAIGDVIHYTITARNTGNRTLASVTVSDPNVSGLTCVPANGSSLVPGASMTCTGTHTIVQADLDAGHYANSACVDDGSGGAEKVCANVDVPGTQTPALSLTKTADPMTYDSLGDVITYTITATNDGNVTLANVTVSDPTLGTLACTPATGSSLVPGASMTCTGTHTITQADLDAGTYSNTACVDDGTDGAAEACDTEDVPGTQTPHLSLTKTADPMTYDSLGDVVTYTITATNDGNVTLHNVTVSDPTLGTLACTPANGSSLVPGASMTCTGTHTIVQADLDAGTYSNTACVDDGTDGAAEACDTEDVPGTKTPHLSLTKTADPTGYSKLGDVLHYTITATNDGNVTLTNVTVTDALVDDLTCNPANGSDLGPGEALVCTATHTITQADLDAGTYSNTACVDDGTDGAAEACDTEDVPGTKTPHLSLTKTADPTGYSKLGDVLHYTITATNDGNVTLTNVTVSDLTLGTLACTPANGSSLVPGASMTCTGTHTITQADLDAGKYANTACVDDGPMGAEQACQGVEVPAVQSPALTLVKTATPATYSAAGTLISYSYALTNTGNVTLVAPFSVDDDLATDESCPPTPTSLAPGASITCTASYTITQADVDAGSVTNIAQGHGFFGTTPVNSNQDTETVTADQNPHLSITKKADLSSYDSVGDVISYSYVLTNTGNVTLIAPFTVTDDKATDESCPTTPTSLAPGATIICHASYTITQVDLDAGSLTNTAKGHGFFGETPVDSGYDTVTVPAVQSPALSIIKTAAPLLYDAAGTVIYYDYLVTNSGNVTLYNISVVDDKATVTCLPEAATLVPGATITCHASYTITQADVDAGSVTNTAQGHGSFGGKPVDSNEDSVTVTADQKPAISLVKSGTFGAGADGYANVGELISYTFVVSNTGNVTLHNVTVSDPLPGLSAITCDATTIPVGEFITCTATYAVTQADIDAGKVTNLATADSDESEPDTDDETVTLPQHPAIDIVKTTNGMDGGTFLVGSTITWKYVVTNTGNVTLSNIAVNDSDLGAITCPKTSLAVSESMNCTATGTATLGLYENIGTVTADGPQGGDVTASDSSSYFGANPQIAIEKVTVDGATSGDALNILTGESIKWRYTVTNTGNVALSNVSVTDSKSGVTPVYVSGDTNNDGLLDLTETWIYEASGTAVTGSYANTGTAAGKFTDSAGDSRSDTATDGSSYFGANPQIAIEKVTVDGTTSGDALNILTGESIKWRYTVTNTGNVALSSITVTDSKSGVTPVYVSGDTNNDGLLDLDETWIYEASGSAVTGSYANTGTASGSFTDSAGDSRSDTASDSSSYFGADPQIAIAKVTVDGATSGDALNILTGESIKWRYTVTNTGNVPLSSITVTDSKSGVTPVYVSGDANSNGKLDLTETWIYEASGTAVTGSYANTGTASGKFTDSAGHVGTATATDGSAYFGANPQIDIVKKTVGADGTEGDNVLVLPNAAVTWKYYITNTGNVALSNVTVTDSKVGAVCTIGSLAVGGSATCTKTGTNTTPAGTWYNNTGTATGSYTDSAGHSRTATDSDASGYYSSYPGAVTNSSLCDFGTNFRLIFTPDMQRYTSSTPYYKLSDSNPGQFFYNVFYTGTAGDVIKLEIPYPFVTQGANPVHVYGGVTVSGAGSSPTPDHLVNCFVPQNELGAYSKIITLANYGTGSFGSTTTVTVTVPVSGFVYINIHLDYGLEKTDGWIKKGSNAYGQPADGLNTALDGKTITDLASYTFKAYANNVLIPGSTDTVKNSNTFKQIRGFGGLVQQWDAGLAEYKPVSGATVQLYLGTTLKATMTTDADGWFLSTYVHSGKAATYTFKLVGTTLTKTVTVGGPVKYGDGTFRIGGPDPIP